MHETASGKLEAEGVIKAILQPGRRHATPAYLPGLQSNVTSIIPAHIRLYQVRYCCLSDHMANCAFSTLLSSWLLRRPAYAYMRCVIQDCKMMTAVHGRPHGNVTCQGWAALRWLCLLAETKHTVSSQSQMYHNPARHAVACAFLLHTALPLPPALQHQDCSSIQLQQKVCRYSLHHTFALSHATPML